MFLCLYAELYLYLWHLHIVQQSSKSDQIIDRLSFCKSATMPFSLFNHSLHYHQMYLTCICLCICSCVFICICICICNTSIQYNRTAKVNGVSTYDLFATMPFGLFNHSMHCHHDQCHHRCLPLQRPPYFQRFQIFDQKYW